MTHDVIVILAALGVAGQVLAVLLLLVGLAWLFGAHGPGDRLRRALEGYELWCVFLVASIATGGSLFFSEVAGFIPCELCWYQRICMYPLSIISLLAALANDRRVARYLLLIENGVVEQAKACLLSAPGGCATKWINEFGYMTIPTLALTGFALCFAFLLLASLPPLSAATVQER